MPSNVSPRVYWIQASEVGRLAVVARPTAHLGLAQQMMALRNAGIDRVVSLLTPGEAATVGLADEESAAREAGVVFASFPITDFAVPPSFAAVSHAIEGIVGDLRGGRGVGVHCYAGRGRSPMFAASVLVHQGYTPDIAIDVVSAARGVRIPETPAQRQWIGDFSVWCRDREGT